jgi:hypothetical protein
MNELEYDKMCDDKIMHGDTSRVIIELLGNHLQ